MEQLRNVAAVWRAGLGIGVMGLVSGAVLVLSSSGCGGVECGTGTVEVDGVCKKGGVLECAPGFKANGDECVPNDDWLKIGCGKNTEWDPDSRSCIGKAVESDSCTGTCPAPTATGVSLCGKVYDGLSLLKKWADPTGATKATPVKASDGAYIRVYDPIQFVQNPTGAAPINKLDSSALIQDDKGCFYIGDVTIPFSGFFAVAVDDEKTSGTKWAFVAAGETPLAGKNSTDLEIPALSEAQVKLFGADLVKDGSMIMVFRDKISGRAVEGVTPIFDGNPPPWTGAEIKYFADDPSTAPYFDATASTTNKTTKSGALAVKKAQVKTFSGQKTGCSFEGGLGGSSPGTLFFRFFDVSGC